MALVAGMGRLGGRVHQELLAGAPHAGVDGSSPTFAGDVASELATAAC